MRKQIAYVVLFILLGCTMKNANLASFIVGKWESEAKDSEWGVVTMKITFTEKNTFKVENFFGEQTTPLIIEGSYTFDGSHIIAKAWNKGKPIKVSKENNKLILETNEDLPIVLHRVNLR